MCFLMRIANREMTTLSEKNMSCGIICIVWTRIVSSNRKDIHSNLIGRCAANYFFT